MCVSKYTYNMIHKIYTKSHFVLSLLPDNLQLFCKISIFPHLRFSSGKFNISLEDCTAVEDRQDKSPSIKYHSICLWLIPP